MEQAALHFRVLGPLEVTDGEGRALRLAGPKQRALLAVLLLHAGEPVDSDRLIEALLGDAPPAQARNSVQVYVSQVRKLLGGRVQTRAGAYVLELEPGDLDLGIFERLAGEGRALLAEGDARAAADRLACALAQWRGPALDDLRYEPFAQDAVRRLEELRVDVVEDRVEADLAAGRHAEVVAELRGLVAAHPLRERLRGQLMLALYQSGRQADALAAFRDGRRLLVEELGIEPGPSLRALHDAILAQDPGLRAPARRSARRVAPRRRIVAVAAGGRDTRDRGRPLRKPSRRSQRRRA